MATKLKIDRRHCESGSVEGTWGKSSIPVDYSWNSHELWINGRCNPEEHPLEEKVREIFEECHEEIRRKYPTLRSDKDIWDVPFTADFDRKNGVSNLVISITFDKGSVGTLSECLEDLDEAGLTVNPRERGLVELVEGENRFSVDGCEFVVMLV